MALTVLGRVGMIARGVYSPNETYERLDTVAYNGAAYVALKTVIGVTPSNDGVSWRVMVNAQGITDAAINADGDLVLTLTDGSTKNLGRVVGRDAPDITREFITEVLGYEPASAGDLLATRLNAAYYYNNGLNDLTPLLETATLIGGIDGRTGEDKSSANYVRTDYIPVRAGDTIRFKGLKANGKDSAYAVFAAYALRDGALTTTFIQLGNTVSTSVSTSHDIDEDGYVRFSRSTQSAAAGPFSVELVSRSRELLDSADINISMLFGFENTDVKPLLTTYGAIDAVEGRVSSGIQLYITKPIRLPAGYTIKATGASAQAGNLVLAVYDLDGTYIRAESVEGKGLLASQTLDFSYTAPDNRLIRLSQNVAVEATWNAYTATVIPGSGQSVDPAEKFISQFARAAQQEIASRNADHPCLNFALITDTHMYKEGNTFACENNVKLFNRVANYCDFAVHCGDVAESGNMQGSDPSAGSHVERHTHIANISRFLQLTEGIHVPLYIAHGNHDVNRYVATSPGQNALLSSRWYNMVRPRAATVHANADDPDSGYYYVDYEEFRCRVVVTNYYNAVDEDGYAKVEQAMGNAQTDWIINTALDIPAGWTVIIFNHAWQFTRGSIPQKIAALRAAGTPVIFIHGNDHQDDYTNQPYRHNSSTWDKTYAGTVFNVIGVDNSFVKVRDTEVFDPGSGPQGEAIFAQGWNETGVPGTETEYCVDIFTVDFADGKIYEKRLGRGFDREYSFGPADSDNHID